MKNNDTITNLLVRLNLVFRDISLDEETAKVYASALSDIDIEALKKACKNYLQTGDKFPLPYQLINLCKKYNVPITG